MRNSSPFTIHNEIVQKRVVSLYGDLPRWPDSFQTFTEIRPSSVVSRLLFIENVQLIFLVLMFLWGVAVLELDIHPDHN